jgi:charged multivesicular body protein 7
MHLKATADKFIEVHKGSASLNLSESLYTPESFKKQARTLLNLSLTDTDVQVLIRYLVRDRRVLVAESQVGVSLCDRRIVLTSTQALKFMDTNSPQREITSIDRGVLEMKATIEKLDAQVEDLANKIAS